MRQNQLRATTLAPTSARITKVPNAPSPVQGHPGTLPPARDPQDEAWGGQPRENRRETLLEKLGKAETLEPGNTGGAFAAPLAPAPPRGALCSC